jgi:hypothetical protein
VPFTGSAGRTARGLATARVGYVQPPVRALGCDRAGGGVNLPRISKPPTTQILRERVIVQAALANGGLSEAERFLLARLVRREQ